MLEIQLMKAEMRFCKILLPKQFLNCQILTDLYNLFRYLQWKICLIKTFNDYKSGLGITAEHGCISKLGKPQLWLDYQSSLSIMEQGFIPLFYNKVQEGIIFYSLPSISSTLFTNKKITSEVSLGQQLVNQLPYLMMIARVLQYLRVIQRDTIGTNDLQVVKKILNESIYIFSHYV